MKEHLHQLIGDALARLQEEGILPANCAPTIQIERTRDKQHGDFASNIAMVLAKQARQRPRDLAEIIVARMPAPALRRKRSQQNRSHNS